MRKRKLKAFVVPILYVISIAVLLGGVFVLEENIRNNVMKSDDVPVVDEVIDYDDSSSSEVPVISNQPVISRPYRDGNVKIVKNYYHDH